MSLFHPKKSNAHGGQPSPIGGVLKRVGEDPVVDWGIILIVCLVISCALLVFGYTEYSDVSSTISDQSAPAVEKNATILDADMLDSVLQDSAARAAERAGLLKGYSGPGDPSI